MNMKVKTTKKLFSILLAVAMMLAMVVTASAATITVTNTNAGETYTAYKLFDVTTAGTGENTSYSYTTDDKDLVEALSSHGVTFDESAAGGLWYVTNVDVESLTSYLKSEAGENLLSVAGRATATVAEGENSATATINVETSGYYFVTSSLGSLCILNTSADSIEIKEKNEEPTVEKTVSDANAQIGDTVTYTVEIDVPANTESLTLNDTLSNGLTLNADSFTIAVDDEDESQVLNVSSTTNDDGTTSFSVNLTSYLTGEDCTITVTYEATINANAIHTNPATNSATVSYGNNSSSTSSTTTTKTHLLTIKKTDGEGNELDGAEFQLKDVEGNLVSVVGNATNGYRVATPDEISDHESGATTTIVVNGSVTIDGLDAETYTLTETKAPDGYNLLTGSKTVTVTTDDTALITIVNEAGSTLPTTGGMGTTIIYIVGAVLVIGAGIVLVVRRRMSANQ